MKSGRKSKILSLLLTLTMVLTFMPALSVTASAADTVGYTPPGYTPPTPPSGGDGGSRAVPPKITTEALPNGATGMAYSRIFTATGDAVIFWSIEDGVLPDGLTLSESGMVSGTPLEAGSFEFIVKAANRAGEDQKSFTIEIVDESDYIKVFRLTPDGNVSAIPVGETILYADGNQITVPNVIYIEGEYGTEQTVVFGMGGVVGSPPKPYLDIYTGSAGRAAGSVGMIPISSGEFTIKKDNSVVNSAGHTALSGKIQHAKKTDLTVRGSNVQGSVTRAFGFEVKFNNDNVKRNAYSGYKVNIDGYEINFVICSHASDADVIDDRFIDDILTEKYPSVYLEETYEKVLSTQALDAIKKSGKNLKIILENGFSYDILAGSITPGANPFNLGIGVAPLKEPMVIDGVKITGKSIVITPVNKGKFGLEIEFTMTKEQLNAAGIMDGGDLKLWHVDEHGKVEDTNKVTKSDGGGLSLSGDDSWFNEVFTFDNGKITLKDDAPIFGGDSDQPNGQSDDFYELLDELNDLLNDEDINDFFYDELESNSNSRRNLDEYIKWKVEQSDLRGGEEQDDHLNQTLEKVQTARNEKLKQEALSRDPNGGAHFTIDSASYYVLSELAPGNPFADVLTGAWYYDDVVYAYTNDLMNGTAADKFSPGMTLSRGMIVTVLWRMAGSPDDRIPSAAGGGQFADIPENAYYYQAVNWAAEKGIVTGYGSGNFGAGDPVTRQDLTVMIERYMSAMGINPPVTQEWIIFADEDGQTVINPKDNATRAEASAMLHRWLQ